MKYLKYLLQAPAFLLVFLLLSPQVTGQERFPAAGVLFDDSSVPRVDIAIHPDSLEQILMQENLGSDHEYMATFTFTRGTDIYTIDSVGFRLRGNTSRQSAKKSFKVSLNTFISGQKFFGVEKINLNGEHNDPSIARARICWYLFNKAGVPASRSNHVELYINDEYRGLYINVEHVDEEFVDLRFGYQNGNLYKCLWPADLHYLGTSPDLYKFESGGRMAYELKRLYAEGDYTDLANFIDVLNNTPLTDLPKDLNMAFNVNTYLKNLVVEVLTGHWDAYAWNKNNYYLYHNPGTGKFEFIPYDPDNTMGISWFEEDWTDRDIYHWEHQGEYRPLVERILDHPLYADRYSFYMKRFLDAYFSPSHLNPFVEGIRDQVDDFAAFDTYRSYDYGYTYDDFYDSYDIAAGAHVRTGIKPFINIRHLSALDQLNVNPIDPIISLLYVNNPGYGETAEIDFLVEDDNAISEVKIWFSMEDEFIPYGPENRGNGLFHARYAGLSTESSLKYYMTATDSEGNTSRDPVEGWYEINNTIVDRSEDHFLRSSFLVYPNPSSGIIHVRLPDNQMSSEFIIYDATGRNIYRGKGRSGEFTVELPGELTNGVYILELQSLTIQPGAKAFRRFILNR